MNIFQRSGGDVGNYKVMKINFYLMQDFIFAKWSTVP